MLSSLFGPMAGSMGSVGSMGGASATGGLFGGNSPMSMLGGLGDMTAKQNENPLPQSFYQLQQGGQYPQMNLGQQTQPSQVQPPRQPSHLQGYFGGR